MLRAFRENWVAVVIAVALSLVTIRLVTEPASLPDCSDVLVQTQEGWRCGSGALVTKTTGGWTNEERIIQTTFSGLTKSAPNGSVRYVVDRGRIYMKIGGKWQPVAEGMPSGTSATARFPSSRPCVKKMEDGSLAATGQDCQPTDH